ncbi:Ammonium transporter [Plasmodiophora brassicae]
MDANLTVAGNVLLLPSTNGAAVPFAETGYASTGFLVAMSALVFLMTPGLGLFYSGLSNAKNALSLIMVCLLSMALISVQWLAVGFSFAFSETGSFFMGNFDHAGFNNVDARAMALTAPAVPSIAFALYQMQFATITPALIFGSISDRFRIVPAMVFVVVWATLIYDPVAYWSWGARGWLHNLTCLSTTSLSQAPCGVGMYDFAGGGPVHIASGFAGLAYALVLGRSTADGGTRHKPHNVANVFLGTALLWFGWFGFNGGSALAATARAAMAATVTTMAASSAAIAWVVVDYLRHRKISGVGFCSGAVVGLVGITPGSGYVAPWASVVVGAVTSLVCNLAANSPAMRKIDDSLDTFSAHGLGGIIGNVLTGVFAQKWVGTLDGTALNGGAIDGNAAQVLYQIIGSAAIAAYSFVGSVVILKVLDRIPGLHLRPTPEDQAAGADLVQMGELVFALDADAPAKAV